MSTSDWFEKRRAEKFDHYAEVVKETLAAHPNGVPAGFYWEGTSYRKARFELSKTKKGIEIIAAATKKHRPEAAQKKKVQEDEHA